MEENQNKKIKIIANQDLCISAASCVAIAPKYYKLNENGKVEVIEEEVPYDQEAVNGAMSCPVMAITIIDVETGKKIFPAE